MTPGTTENPVGAYTFAHCERRPCKDVNMKAEVSSSRVVFVSVCPVRGNCSAAVQRPRSGGIRRIGFGSNIAATVPQISLAEQRGRGKSAKGGEIAGGRVILRL